MNRARRLLLSGACIAVCLAFSALGLAASSVEPQEPVLASLRQRVMALQKARLPNGLRIVMDVEPESPTVAVCVTYDVGSRNEGEGQSGFAHLFEHMMFQGSRHVPKGKHFQIVAARGGTLKWDHERRPNQLFRDGASQRARASALVGSRSNAMAQCIAGELGQSTSRRKRRIQDAL